MPLFIFKYEKSFKLNFDTSANRTTNWGILSGNVMEELSDAQIKYDSTSVMVKGFVSLKNRGGFVSIKSTWTQAELPFGGTEGSCYGRELSELGINKLVNKKLIKMSKLSDPCYYYFNVHMCYKIDK